MKKLSLALVAFLALSFAGCNGWLDIPDPEPEPEPEPEPVEEALITLEETSATLHSGETYQIQAECEYPITYTSENEFHAIVSEEGEVTARYVGSTTITLEAETDTQTFEVTVEPTSDLYPEPEIEFGETKEALIERMGQPDEEEEDAIAYYNYSENAMMLMVMFGEEGLVEEYGLVLDPSFEEELDTFLGERYMYVQEEEGIKIYINALTLEEASMIVGSQAYDGEGVSFIMSLYAGYGSEPVEMSAGVKAILKAYRNRK